MNFMLMSYEQCQSCAYFYVGELRKLQNYEFYVNALRIMLKVVVISM